nr:MAG TPA: hypothetical protein [Caudoviricetes sp.]
MVSCRVMLLPSKAVLFSRTLYNHWELHATIFDN